MNRKNAVVGWAALAVLTLSLGCGDDNKGGTKGRGTAACNSWQSAYCSFATKCGATKLCDQVTAFACKSDAVATECANKLKAATCEAPPANCDALDMADPTPAKKACEDFEAAFCQRVDQCVSGTRDTCLDSTKTMLDCTKALGVTLQYEQCMADVPKMACEKLDSPPSCTGIVLLGP
jgi:hypothetical protein